MSTLWGPPHTTALPTLTRPMTDPGDAEGIPGIDIRLQREALGLSAHDLATHLGVGLRTVQRWETLDHAPAWATVELDHLAAQSLAWLERLETAAEARVWHHGWHILDDGRIAPASWWRHLVGLAMLRNPSLSPHWGDSTPGKGE